MDYSKKSLNNKIEQIVGEEVRQKNRMSVFLFVIVLSILVTVFTMVVSFSIGAFQEIISNSPPLDHLEDISPDETKSIIYASDGSVMQELVQSGSNRITVSYDVIPKNLINAFVSIEDSRFFTHDGVDVKGIFRALFVGVKSGSLSEGASTLTQQLIKNNIFNGGLEKNFGDRIERKFQEQYLALRVERELSKETILQYYLNTINLGSNCLGVQVAANRYFGKDVSELDLSECSVLASITQNPSKYNPLTHPENNQKRRLTVLKYMYENGMITEEEMDEASSEDVYKRIQAHSETYVSDSAHSFSYFTDVVFEDVLSELQDKLDYTDTQAYNLLYSGGLRVYTTMDPKIQKVVDTEINDPENYKVVDENGNVNDYMEYSMVYRMTLELKNGAQYYYDEENVKNYYQDTLGETKFNLTFNSKEELIKAAETFRDSIVERTGGTVLFESIQATLEPQTSVVIVDQKTGYVLAISGGRGEKESSLSLNRATMSKRQPGSCFKIITTYAPALDISGATLATTYYDEPYLVDGRNVSNWWGTDYVGYTNIRHAIVVSMNIVAIKCLEDTVSENTGYSYAQSFGITTLVDEDKSPLMTLGGVKYGVTNEEMTMAYAAIANDGVYNKPIYWTKVTDSQGNVILENEEYQKRILKSTTAKLLTSAMEDSVIADRAIVPAIQIGGTSGECKIPNMPVSGKSGTTNDANDIWFMGFTPYYTCGIWSGYDSSKSFGHSPGYHKRIWQKIMATINEGKENVPFDYSDLEKAEICSKSGLLARDGICNNCGDSACFIYEEYFAPGTAPTEYCTRHVVFNICNASGLPASEFCPVEGTHEQVYLLLDSEDEDAEETLDLAYAFPKEMANTSCNIHVEPEEDEEETESDVLEEFEPDEEAVIIETP